MMNIAENITQLIGHTPLLSLGRFCKSQGVVAELVAKLEYFNPAGSAKDRVALSMVEDAEARGVLRPGGTIIEPTSGNTGIGLAMVAAVKGYKLILTMPETMSEERRRLLAAYGATLVLTPGAEGMQGAIRRAEEICAETPGAVILSQFDNPANPLAHRRITGEEIWRDTEGKVAVFVASVGTGGTISGVAAALKAHNPAVHIVAVEPEESPVLSGGSAAPHGIQGIGAGFVPKNYDSSLVDEVLPVSTESALQMMRAAAKTEGLLVGISSGAVLAAALEISQRETFKDKLIIALLPDTGERYLSVPKGLFHTCQK